MLLYIRHGDDRGHDAYQHDRRLNDRGRSKARKKAKRLIAEYGHPDLVHVSPFRRAVDTLQEMSARFERPVSIHPDPRIAQHLSEEKQRDPKVSPATLAQITMPEGRDAFRRRIAEHVAAVLDEHGVIWCITHQAVIEEIARHFYVKISSNLDFLDHVVMLG